MPRLWYNAPADTWNEALPLGNGRMGAMCFGGTLMDRFQLNDDSVWSGGCIDRINPDAAKDPRAVSAEETVLGLLLIFEEYRNAVDTGEVALSADGFVTEFNRRVFEEIMRLHRSDTGLRPELLVAVFTPDEMGRIERTEVARQQLTNNGPEVFRSAVNALKEAKSKESAQSEDLKTRLERLRQKQAKLHKGKADQS